MKTFFLDLMAGLAFLVVLLITHSVAWATIVATAIGAGQIAWLLSRREPVPAVQWTGLALVVVLGGASIVTRDARFVMLKPSLLQAGLAASLLRRGWLRRYIKPETLALLPPEAVVRAGYVHPIMLMGLSATNLAVALNATTEAWATYNAIAPGIAFAVTGLGLFLVLRLQARASRRQGLTWTHSAQPALADRT